MLCGLGEFFGILLSAFQRFGSQVLGDLRCPAFLIGVVFFFTSLLFFEEPRRRRVCSSLAQDELPEALFSVLLSTALFIVVK